MSIGACVRMDKVYVGGSGSGSGVGTRDRVGEYMEREREEREGEEFVSGSWYYEHRGMCKNGLRCMCVGGSGSGVGGGQEIGWGSIWGERREERRGRVKSN
jgi:hypothetical protein